MNIQLEELIDDVDRWGKSSANGLLGLHGRSTSAQVLHGRAQRDYRRLQTVLLIEDSKELTARGRFPAVIISASGMATGGRVLHHLESLASDPRNTILLPGFQAPGTRGAGSRGDSNTRA